MSEDFEDAHVDVEDEYIPPPENKDPIILINFYRLATYYIANYGWYILGLTIALYFLWKRVIQPALNDVRKSAQLNTHKKFDVSEVERRQLAMDAHRRRLQEEHDRKATEYATKQAELEAKKRQEKLEDWERHQSGLGYRSKVKKAEGEETPATVIAKNKKKLRDNDFSPLMGNDGGGSGSWSRPSRRGPAAGGG